MFANKPLIIAANKTDIIKLEDLTPERRAFLKEIEEDPDLSFIEMSTVTDDGIIAVKTEACEKLLRFRVDQKMRTKKVRFTCFMVQQKRCQINSLNKKLSLKL